MSLRTKIYGGYFFLLCFWLIVWFYLNHHVERVHTLLEVLTPLEHSRSQLVKRIHSGLRNQERLAAVLATTIETANFENNILAMSAEMEAIQYSADSLLFLSSRWHQTADKIYSSTFDRLVLGLGLGYSEVQEANQAAFRNEILQISDLKTFEERIDGLLKEQMAAADVRHTRNFDPKFDRRVSALSDSMLARLNTFEMMSNQNTLVRINTVNEISHSMNWLSYGILAVTLIFVVILTHDVRQILSGFKALKSAAQDVAQGRLQPHVPARGFKEMEELLAAFNAMTDQLRELENLKSDFFSKLVHDFKSPLDNIKQSADVLLNDITGETLDPNQKKFLEIIKRSASNLRTMVQEQLNESKLIAGQSELKYEMCDLKELIRDRIELQRPTAVAKQVSFSMKFNEASFTIACDRNKICRVMDNLLSNAIKFSRSDTRITVELEDKGEHVQIRIKDSGVGIPTEKQNVIFKKYGRLSSSDMTTGTGLGLYTAKYIVELHRGSIWFKSKSGYGSTFYFTLPKEPPIVLPPNT